MSAAEDRLQEIREILAQRAKIASDRAYGESSLYNFVKLMWPILEPATPFIEGWLPQAICEHLEAVTDGEIKKLLINVPTGFSKSIIVSTCWPAWEWGPCNMAWLRYLSFSYSQRTSIRDSVRTRDLITSQEYQELWGDRVVLTGDQNAKENYANTAKGWRLASSVGGTGTGLRGNRIILDDPHSVSEGESKAVIESTTRWFREVIPTRLNSHSEESIDSIIVIMQRVSELDISGEILAKDLGYTHLCIPMDYDTKRHCVTKIGWQDPRGLDDDGNPLFGAALDAREGMLAWPERIDNPQLAELKKDMGPYAVASQLNQSPTSRGGAIFDRDDWQPWPPFDWWDKWEREGRDLAEISRRPETVKYPPFEMVCASLDTAHTEKRENDYSALTIWGIWRGQEERVLPTTADAIDESRWSVMPAEEVPKLMLVHGWQKRLLLHGPPMKLPDGVNAQDWQRAMRRTYRPGEFHAPPTQGERIALNYIKTGQHKEKWGLVEWVADSCRRYKVDQLLIEASAAGFGVSSEMKRLYADLPFAVNLIPTGPQDKVARAHTVQHLFSNKQVYVWKDHEGMPKDWAQLIIDQMATFPKSAHDDLCDSSVQAVSWLRNRNWLLRDDEAEAEWAEQMKYKPPARKLYDV